MNAYSKYVMETRAQRRRIAPIAKPERAEFFEGVMSLHIAIRVSPKEMRTWSPDRIARFFAGIAMAQSAVEA